MFHGVKKTIRIVKEVEVHFDVRGFNIGGHVLMQFTKDVKKCETSSNSNNINCETKMKN